MITDMSFLCNLDVITDRIYFLSLDPILEEELRHGLLRQAMTALYTRTKTA